MRLADDKTEGSTEVLVFLGLELDTINMIVLIPHQKVLEIVEKIEAVLNKIMTILKEMQSLIGSLNFACRAVIARRPFCRRLINSICGLTKPHHHLRFSREIRLNLVMWLEFFNNHNGISMFHNNFWVSNENEKLFTNSAGGQGLGIYFNGHMLHGLGHGMRKE